MLLVNLLIINNNVIQFLSCEMKYITQLYIQKRFFEIIYSEINPLNGVCSSGIILHIYIYIFFFFF